MPVWRRSFRCGRTVRPGSRFLTAEGYAVNRGSSFIMVVGFDQTELCSRKGWRETLFTEEQIRAVKALRTMTVTGCR